MIGTHAIDHTQCVATITAALAAAFADVGPALQARGVDVSFYIDQTLPAVRNRFCKTAVCPHGVTWWVQPTGRLLTWMDHTARHGHWPDFDGSCG